MTLVDSCVWIDFLRGVENPQTRALERLLNGDDACLCETVYAEILWGAPTARRFRDDAGKFSKIPFLNLPPSWHERAAEMGHVLRLAGHAPFLADILIALTAIAHEVPLLTRDRDFEVFKKRFGLILA